MRTKLVDFKKRANTQPWVFLIKNGQNQTLLEIVVGQSIDNQPSGPELSARSYFLPSVLTGCSYDGSLQYNG